MDDESGQGRSTREYVRRYVGRDWESTITTTANWQTAWGSMARELLLANRQLPVLNAKTVALVVDSAGGCWSRYFALFIAPPTPASLTWGLTRRAYNKVDTVKNLAKPWESLPIQVDSSTDAESETYHHSPLTTLLLDDSPAKARLQPWDQLCINEFTGAMRVKDEMLWRRRKASIRLPEAGASFQDHEGDTTTCSAPSASAPTSTSAATSPPTEKFDETLLAVIGVLAHIRTQENVAAWVRAGGLFDIGAGESNIGASESEPMGMSVVQPGLSPPTKSCLADSASASAPPPSQISSSGRR